MSSPPDTLLIDGTDIRSVAGVEIVGDMNLFAPGTRRGNDDVVPGQRGMLAAPGLVLDAYAFTVDLKIKAANRGQRDAYILALGALLVGTNNDGLIGLTRRLANSSDTGYDSYTAQGRFVTGLNFQVVNPGMAQTQLQFLNLSGAWKNASNVWIIP
jgi:hypothetical protein